MTSVGSLGLAPITLVQIINGTYRGTYGPNVSVLVQQHRQHACIATKVHTPDYVLVDRLAA